MPTLIKVDIEGSEADFLNGAKVFISGKKPKMALSIYHYPSDIFLLPLQLIELNPQYNLILRHHSSMLMDTLVYAY